MTAPTGRSRQATPGLRIGFQVWGQFVGWHELMEMGRRIDELGFDSLWSNDHLLPVAGGGAQVLEVARGPVWDGWMTLAGWAERTETVTLGCLVSGAAYRNPGLLVRMASALDHASGGRAILGLGAGWHAAEHLAFGYDYASLPERLDRLDEAATICRAMLDGEAADAEGRWFSAHGARAEPPPLQPRLPLLIGGSGERRTLPIVARVADAWNGEGDPPTYARKSALLDRLCRDRGRDPASVRRTVGLPPPLIRGDRDEAVRTLADQLARHGLGSAAARDASMASPFVGSAEQVTMQLQAYADAGAQEVIFDWPSPADEATLVALAGPIRDALAAPRSGAGGA
jgi:alkanesulfonate monooxygenase SsuD/methylene tetrahydromethanopterin reductase-like flavin-dependent oxidoreductase (luciferase family)